MAARLPVYLFTGFLEGGKTHIIQESMEDQKFNSGEKTLIIQCEEGVDELDLSAIRVGDVLTYTLDAYGEKAFTGTITEIRPIGAARQNATYFDVRITAPKDATILPGMNATVIIP